MQASIRVRFIHFIHLALACLLLAATSARADLMLHPTRVVFEKGMQTAQVDLINNGAEAATYRLRLVNRRMAETGEFTPADNALPGELFAEPLLRFSPRQVTVPAGGVQTVRIMLRRGADLADGEYRSHLQFDRVAQDRVAPDRVAQDRVAPDRVAQDRVAPDRVAQVRVAQDQGAQDKPSDPAAQEASQGTPPKDIGIALTALLGASMPVIVRQGAVAAGVKLSQLRLDKGALSLLFERSGGASVYGDLTVTFLAAGAPPQQARQVAAMHGVAVYTPNPLRRASLALTAPPGVTLAGGVLTATYRERADKGGAVLASASLALP